jgi:hypothetical protein
MLIYNVLSRAFTIYHTMAWKESRNDLGMVGSDGCWRSRLSNDSPHNKRGIRGVRRRRNGVRPISLVDSYPEKRYTKATQGM